MTLLVHLALAFYLSLRIEMEVIPSWFDWNRRETDWLLEPQYLLLKKAFPIDQHSPIENVGFHGLSVSVEPNM